jgi:hypothetical protein
MKNTALCCIIPALLVNFIAGCTTPATEPEISQMCENLIRVRNEVRIPVESELVAEIEADYTRRKEHLVSWKEREMKSWDDELRARLETLAADTKAAKPKKGEPDPKVALEEEYAKKKQIGADQFDSDIEALVPARELAIKAARDKVAAKKAEFEAARKDCIEKARTENISQPVAQCRIKASDPDTYWNKCR